MDGGSEGRKTGGDEENADVTEKGGEKMDHVVDTCGREGREREREKERERERERERDPETWHIRTRSRIPPVKFKIKTI